MSNRKTRIVAKRRAIQKTNRIATIAHEHARERRDRARLAKAEIDAQCCRMLLDAGLEREWNRAVEAFDVAKAAAAGMGIPRTYLTMMNLSIISGRMGDNIHIMSRVASNHLIGWNAEGQIRWGLEWCRDNISPMEMLRLVAAFPRRDLVEEL